MRITTFFNHETLMNQVTLLREALRPHLAWHGARLSFLVTFLIALLQVKTINFAELASAFGGKAHIDSHYKRIQRFFRLYELDLTQMAQAVVESDGNFRTLGALPRPNRVAIWRVCLQHLDAGSSA
jgi:hypothetical protein